MAGLKKNLDKNNNKLVMGMIIMFLAIFGCVFSTVGYHAAIDEVDSLENRIDHLNKEKEAYRSKFEDAETKNRNLKATVNKADPYFKNLDLNSDK